MKEKASAGVEGYEEAAVVRQQVVLQQVRTPVRGRTVHILHCIGVALELHYSAVHNSACTVMTQATCAVTCQVFVPLLRQACTWQRHQYWAHVSIKCSNQQGTIEREREHSNEIQTVGCRCKLKLIHFEGTRFYYDHDRRGAFTGPTTIAPCSAFTSKLPSV